MKRQRSFIGVLALGLLLVLAVGLSQVQGAAPPAASASGETEFGAAAVVDNRIPIQGRLTNDGGSPLTGSYIIRFRLYDDTDTVLCEDIHTVIVDGGLFSTYIDGCMSSDISGQQLFLGIKVGDDAEMTERQPIYPVPYALSLRPGAIIDDTDSYVEMNRYDSSGVFPTRYGVYATADAGGTVRASGVYGRSDGGHGVDGYSEGGFGVNGYSHNVGVRGASDTGSGVVGVSDSGPGVECYSDSGAALAVSGTGIIQSSARSYLWISGNGLRARYEADTTVIDLDSAGGAIISPGTNLVEDKYVMLPVTVVGPLYGQNVTISGLDIYWRGDTEFDGISWVGLRRQIGVGTHITLVNDSTDRTCEDSVVPQGCTIHYDITSNNVLSPDSGVFYLVLGLKFGGELTWIQIGGARLTLEHD